MTLLLALLLMVVLVRPVPASQSLDVALDGYRTADAAGAVASLAGRAFVEGRRPSDAPTPIDGVTLVLVPHSEVLVERLEDLRRRAREDTRAYGRAAADLRHARTEFQEALKAAGAGDLVRTAKTARDGRFTLSGVPAGRWLLIAERPVFVARPGPKPSKHDRDTFAPRAPSKGYWVVTMWLREIVLRAGAAETIELKGRDVWVTAIQDQQGPGTGG